MHFIYRALFIGCSEMLRARATLCIEARCGNVREDTACGYRQTVDVEEDMFNKVLRLPVLAERCLSVHPTFINIEHITGPNRFDSTHAIEKKGF